ncbi:MAG: ribonuclease H-like domain-containing protein, partial [Deltaproteobacteria bacterium]|nr:ribonuclease H-like domain-containing protein [Deltaproteobacteria bacterium]
MKSEKAKRESLERIGRRLREGLERSRDYRIVEEGEVTSRSRGTSSFFYTEMDEWQYREAQRLKRKLLKEHEGMRLEDVIRGEVIETGQGTCYLIRNRQPLKRRHLDPARARKRILLDLKLIYGIGEATEKALKHQGYHTIEGLADHPRFGRAAKEFLKVMDRGDTSRLLTWIGRWFQKSHPLAFLASGFHRDDDFIILDIETLGIFLRPIILIGVARLGGEDLTISQYLIRDVEEEPAALAGLLSHLDGVRAFITFNGRAFDIPYIRDRLAYYRMPGDIERAHFDILHFSRRAWRGQFPDCRLTTLERNLFGIERTDDVPSSLVPEFYETYMRTGNAGPLIPIVEHNRMDLVTLTNL